MFSIFLKFKWKISQRLHRYAKEIVEISNIIINSFILSYFMFFPHPRSVLPVFALGRRAHQIIVSEQLRACDATVLNLANVSIQTRAVNV